MPSSQRGADMRRRQFITLLSGAAATWSVVARGQSIERMRQVGVLAPWSVNDAEAKDRVTAFVQSLQQLGWTNGQNIRIEYRFGDGKPDAMRKSAAELVAITPDVI